VLFRSAIFTALTLLALSASALPFKDVHQTTMELLAEAPNVKSFAVAIKRIDDLESDDGNNIIAEKQSTVIISFDVDSNGQISANGVPVSMGLSNVKVEAATISLLSAAAEAMTPEQLAEAYDVGLVDMTIAATSETVIVDGFEITRLTLRETITEINGVQVEQNSAMQQIFDIKDNQVIAHMPCAAPSSSQLLESAPLKQTECKLYKVAKWMRQQTVPVRIAASILSGAIFGLLVILFVRVFARLFALRGYSRVVLAEADESVHIKKISMKEKEQEAAKEELLPQYE